MDTSGDDLISLAVSGDRDALVLLLKRYGGAARQAIDGKIPRRWQSLISYDDVMQQTYADAAAGIGSFRSDHEGSFAKWFATIAKRNLRNAIKMLEAEKRGGDRKRVTGITDESYATLVEHIARTSGTPSRAVAGSEAGEILNGAIAQLPDDYARVVQMYDLEGRSVRKVAEALDRSQGAVFMLRARAHERLHEIMGRTSKFFSDSP